MKTIYVIRHGQTDYNKSGIVQGKGVNASLNERGQAQAAAFWNKYKEKDFDVVYTSSLTRSIESVQNFIDAGIPWKKRTGLDEISWGDYDGKSLASSDYYQKTIDRWHAGETSLRPINGESPDDVVSRIKPVVEEIIASEDKNVLICMHGRAMRMLLCYLTENELCEMDQFPHHNLGMYKLTFHEEKFTLHDRNDLSHLEVDVELID